MTEKRFNYIPFDGFEDNGAYITPYQVVELLNNLSDENEQLKNDVYDWKASAEDYLKLGKSLKKENEQLKKQLKPIQKVCEKYRIPIKDLPEILEEYIAYDNDDNW